LYNEHHHHYYCIVEKNKKKLFYAMLHCYFIGLLYRSHWPLTFMLFYIPMYVKKIFNIHYKSARSQTVSDDVFLYLFLRKLRKCKQKSNQHIIKKYSFFYIWELYRISKLLCLNIYVESWSLEDACNWT